MVGFLRNVGVHFGSGLYADSMLGELWVGRFDRDFPGLSRFEFTLFVHQRDGPRFGRCWLRVGNFGHFEFGVAVRPLFHFAFGLWGSGLGQVAASSHSVANAGFEFIVGITAF